MEAHRRDVPGGAESFIALTRLGGTADDLESEGANVTQRKRLIDLEPVLRVLFVVGFLIAMASAVVMGAAAQVYVEDIISSRPVDWYPGLRSSVVALGQASLLSAFVCVAIAWFQTGRDRGQPDRRRHRLALVAVCFGAILGTGSAIWIWASGDPTSFEAIRLRTWVAVAGGFSWPLVALGLGLMTFSP